MSAELERNAYDCSSCGKVRIYDYADKGVTPMFDRCVCGGRMDSRMGVNLPPASEPADFEWYRPDSEEARTLSDAMLDHVLRGGLLPRAKTDEAQAWLDGILAESKSRKKARSK